MAWAIKSTKKKAPEGANLSCAIDHRCASRSPFGPVEDPLSTYSPLVRALAHADV
ncbi:unnamed protein product [Amoebophrya sp. A120]|nr:unnamed protein product [Amoebophrya sp. A120]|eukprot:GSA120T00008703001.1